MYLAIGLAAAILSPFLGLAILEALLEHLARKRDLKKRRKANGL